MPLPVQNSNSWGTYIPLGRATACVAHIKLHPACAAQQPSNATNPNCHRVQQPSVASIDLRLLIDCRFRSRGHLVAQLDPLKRTAGGPWLGPMGDEYTR
jgi:2-oxoglutarate dehydrogenase complex dehydrogenase (E1) component-like enzyme